MDPRAWPTRYRVIAIVAVLALVLYFAAPAVAPDMVFTLSETYDKAVGYVSGRGSVVGPSTTPDANGVIQADPYDLARQAGLDPELYGLSRVAASEAGRRSDTEKVAKMWVAVNDARHKGWSLMYWLTYHKTDFRAGKFGKQISGVVATGSDPHETDVRLARGVLDGSIEDPTGGATKFLDADAFAAQAGTQGTAEAKDAEWVASGLDRIDVEGVSTWFYRPQSFTTG